MNRQILFRGKRVDNDEWVYGDLLHLPNGDVVILSDKGYTKVKPATVGQFTGLFDDKGNKIFDGDILAIDEYSTFENTGKGTCRIYHGEWVSFYGQDLLGRDCYDSLYAVCKERHVIGNIYCNEELLDD